MTSDGSGPSVILFDVGGVLVELLGVPVMMAWTRGRFTEEALWSAWVGSPAVRDFETGRIGPADFARRLVREFDLPVTPEAFLDEFEGWPGRLFPGALDLLARLAPRFRMATLSNTNALHWPIVSGRMGIGDHIGLHFPSHITGVIKPDRRAFEEAVTGLGVRPGRILFLDDSQANVRAAREIGIDARQAVGIDGVRQALSTVGIV